MKDKKTEKTIDLNSIKIFIIENVQEKLVHDKTYCKHTEYFIYFY